MKTPSTGSIITNFLVMCDFCLIGLIFVGGLSLKHKIDQIEEKNAMSVVVLDRNAYMDELIARGFHKNDSRLAIENVADGLSQKGFLVIDSTSVIASPRKLSEHDISKELLDEVRLLAKDRENGQLVMDKSSQAKAAETKTADPAHQTETAELPRSDSAVSEQKTKTLADTLVSEKGRNLLNKLTTSFFNEEKKQ
jgi:hypothetical protein